jgi:hypothetical protein
MNSPTVSQPLPPDEYLEDAIVVASLAHATAKTPEQRRVAWARLLQLKARRDELRRQGRAA